jgi:hypothetical protein
MATVLVEGASPRSRPARPKFYIGMALLITAIVVAGFGPSFYAVFLTGAARPWIIHVHAAVYMGWLALLVLQSVLAARGRIALHRRVGSFGIAYGVLVLIIGLAVSIVVPAMHVATGEWTMDRAASFLPIPLGDMVLFGGFFGAAVAYRHRPEVHKRLIVLAFVALMFAGAGRLWFANSIPDVLLAWYLPVLAGIGYDFYKMRRVHPVYLIGAAIMAAWLVRIPFGESEAWLHVGRALLAPLV